VHVASACGDFNIGRIGGVEFVGESRNATRWHAFGRVGVCMLQGVAQHRRWGWVDPLHGVARHQPRQEDALNMHRVWSLRLKLLGDGVTGWRIEEGRKRMKFLLLVLVSFFLSYPYSFVVKDPLWAGQHQCRVFIRYATQ
jgi:hypothetical protein